jgi:hypothetical protein
MRRYLKMAGGFEWFVVEMAAKARPGKNVRHH